MMLGSLSSDLLAKILQLVLPPLEECIGADSSVRVLPVVLGGDSKGLCELRTVSKSFHDAVKTVPLHVTASTDKHVRSLPLLHGWNIAAVQLCWSPGKTPKLLIKAACELPDRDRNMIVTIGVPGKRVADFAPKLRQLDGVRHMIIDGGTTHWDCLEHLERLDLMRHPDKTELLVLLLPCMHAACTFSRPVLQVRCAVWTSSTGLLLQMLLCRSASQHSPTSKACLSAELLTACVDTGCPPMRWHSAPL